jgi:hypothetical protein
VPAPHSSSPAPLEPVHLSLWLHSVLAVVVVVVVGVVGLVVEVLQGIEG